MGINTVRFGHTGLTLSGPKPALNRLVADRLNKAITDLATIKADEYAKPAVVPAETKDGPGFTVLTGQTRLLLDGMKAVSIQMKLQPEQFPEFTRKERDQLCDSFLYAERGLLSKGIAVSVAKNLF